MPRPLIELYQEKSRRGSRSLNGLAPCIAELSCSVVGMASIIDGDSQICTGPCEISRNFKHGTHGIEVGNHVQNIKATGRKFT